MILQHLPTAEENLLHKKYGSSAHMGIYGAGCTVNPRLMLVFMNPTCRNVASDPAWEGLRAPWIGVNKTWFMFHKFGFLDENQVECIKGMKPSEWTSSVAEEMYSHLFRNGIYVTNLAKCTQVDARHLPDGVFRDYRPSFLEEILRVNPKAIVTFGNQFSSIVMGRPVSVSRYSGRMSEELVIGDKVFRVYPTYYPVGQGQRNMPLAMERVSRVAEG